MNKPNDSTERPGARERILDAAFKVVREKGYTATTVDDLCRSAGVTKGAFFHHFRSKEELGVAAARHWSAVTAALFAAAPYHDEDDPLERVLAYLDFRKDLLAGTVAEFTCLAGTMVQEVHESSPAIRQACMACIGDHAATLEPDIAEAMAARGIDTDGAASLALHTQAVLQGAFILAKASSDPEPAADSIDHLKKYLELLLGDTGSERR